MYCSTISRVRGRSRSSRAGNFTNCADLTRLTLSLYRAPKLKTLLQQSSHYIKFFFEAKKDFKSFWADLFVIQQTAAAANETSHSPSFIDYHHVIFDNNRRWKRTNLTSSVLIMVHYFIQNYRHPTVIAIRPLTTGSCGETTDRKVDKQTDGQTSLKRRHTGK